MSQCWQVRNIYRQYKHQQCVRVRVCCCRRVLGADHLHVHLLCLFKGASSITRLGSLWMRASTAARHCFYYSCPRALQRSSEQELRQELQNAGRPRQETVLQNLLFCCCSSCEECTVRGQQPNWISSRSGFFFLQTSVFFGGVVVVDRRC